VQPQRIVPELHAVFGIEWIEPERRHGEWKLVTNFGDGDDKSIKLGKTFLKETFSLRLVDIDEEREAAERRFPSQHGQQIGCRLKRAGPDLGNRQAEAARQCRGGGTPPAVFRADDHCQRTRALPQPPG
jgi:hypothetical protein